MNRGWTLPAVCAAFESAGTDACRIFSGADGWAERFGADVLISHKTESALHIIRDAMPAWCESVGWHPARIFSKVLPKQNEDRDPPTLMEGDGTTPLTGLVRENGVSFGLDFAAGYSAGLFIDQRMNRNLIRAVAPKRMLNTFAYTCSFSVVAAMSGAETLSVDLSKKSLDRGRANFALNGIDVKARHKFIADDVLEVLPRLSRRGEKFDAIVLDPPTFSRGNGGRRWQVEQHLEDLVIAAMELAAPSARILFSTNCTKLLQSDLERVARFALKFHRRAGDLHREPQPAEFPPSEGARTLWISLRG